MNYKIINIFNSSHSNVIVLYYKWLAIPFAMMNDAVGSIAETSSKWLGSPIRGAWLGYYIDSALLLLLGGIPWQVCPSVCSWTNVIII